MTVPLSGRFQLSAICTVLVALPLFSCSDRNERTPASTAAPRASSDATTTGSTCSAHGAPKELCFICDASLRDANRLWCREHDRYEDRCWECHPELRDPNRLWCAEHSLYEDECFLCHPELRQEPPGPGGTKSISAVLMCKEHGVPEQECGICHPDLLAATPLGQGLKVRLPSTESAAKAGIATGESATGLLPQGIDCLAELTFDRNRIVEITPLVAGVIESVEVDLGSRVRTGGVLARLTSSAMSESQGHFLEATAEEELRRSSLERERELRTERIASQKEVEEAEAAHKHATAAVQQSRQQLLALGLDDTRLRQLASQQIAPGELELRAPFAGEIVERTAVQGGFAEAGRPLFTLADTAVLWAMVSIPESLLSRARIGQPVRLTVESLPGRTFLGKLTWLPATVDGRTRMALGRVEVPNKDGQLKARMFARAFIVTDDGERSVVVPQSAVQTLLGSTLVFVKSEEDLFEARPVRLGARREGRVEIVSGLRPDEPIVVAGGFALKSQLLISRLGAGCVD